MKKTNYMDLDGNSLHTFLVVLDELSVSKAAERLGVTQSAVSHTLTKLRLVLGDPLFVRSGRGISPTQQAQSLREPVREVLDDLKRLTDRRAFDPTSGTLNFTIAANDFQRDLIFPKLLQSARAAGVDVRLHFIPSSVPDASLLREKRCDMIVTPFPPEGPDMLQNRLFEDQLVCFYDSDCRQAPKTLEEFKASGYVLVRFAENRNSLAALSGIDTASLEAPHISVPNFGALAAFIRGTDLIAAELSLMALGPLNGLATAPLPFASAPLVMCLAWHRRDHADPAHEWLRQNILATAQTLVQRLRRE